MAPAERDLIKLLQYGLVEALANAVGLRMLDLGPGVINIVDGQEQLVVVLVRPATILGSTVGHDTQHWKAMFFIERQHLIVE